MTNNLETKEKNTRYKRYIQEFLGYESSKTTEIYTYVSKKAIDKIKNPIDEFF